MQPYSFGVACSKAGSTTTVTCSGPDASCVLSAVYTMLEKTGIHFEVTGPVLPKAADLNALSGWNTVIHPSVQQRGVRQHINFAMDVSSYPLDEAKAYIHNLARLRLNHITFHSYPNQWYSVKMPSGKELTAGSFFYGMRYPIPDDKLISDHVRNKKLFCIPSIEPFDDQKEVKARMAEDWLAAVMSEAKKMRDVGPAFSFELRDQTMEDSLATVDAILKLYPMIDNLELITQETGSDSKKDKSAEEMGKLVESYFGPDAMKDPELKSLITGGGECLTGIINEVGHNTQVAKKLKEMWGNDPTKPQAHSRRLHLRRD